MLQIHIKCSKTDPFRLGCDVFVGRGVGSECPITALSSYLSLCGPAPGPLFLFSDGRPLTWQQLSSFVQSILKGAWYSGSYSGHSFRIEAGCSNPEIPSAWRGGGGRGVVSWLGWGLGSPVGCSSALGM